MSFQSNKKLNVVTAEIVLIKIDKFSISNILIGTN